jgi:DNA-binding transcriptional MerR regulator
MLTLSRLQCHHRNVDDTWTIGELAEQAADLLGSQPSRGGRVRDVPNERLIRWYTTIGLLDPPLSRRGRIALYGPRHLLQLVATKRRQADGRSIADIQAELTGATDETLSAIAGIPVPRRVPSTPPVPFEQAVPAAPAAVPTGTRERFWAAQPASPASAAPRAVAPAAAGVVHGVRLAAGVTVLLDGGQAPAPGDLPALVEAAAPLLAVLAALGLAPAGEEPDPTPEGDRP